MLRHFSVDLRKRFFIAGGDGDGDDVAVVLRF
jgi:hypothetical protein